MPGEVLYSNSNEISEVVESVSGWKVTPLGSLDIPEHPRELFVFDLLFHDRPKEEWTVSELLEKRPEWEGQILPLLKAHGYTLLFTDEWCVMSYLKKSDKVYFRSCLCPPYLETHSCLLSTGPLTFMMRQEIKSLIEPAIRASVMSKKLSFSLKRPVDLGTPLTYHELCDEMEELVSGLDAELERWKDRFFFDALEADEDTLCEVCKENMRNAFYDTKDRSQALKWRPGRGGNCPARNCKHYKCDIFEEDDVLFPNEGSDSD